MALSAPVRLRVDDPSPAWRPSRRAAEQLADDLGFDERRKGEAAIVVTELATNLVRHGGGGEIILRVNRATRRRRSTRSRPTAGRASRTSARAREDGYSTGGGPGNGLGAIEPPVGDDGPADGRRPGRGRARAARRARRPSRSSTGSRSRWRGRRRAATPGPCVRDGEHATILLVDGLGHGDDAATAANAAVRELRPGLDPAALLERMHGALRPTRGAAAAVARWNRRTGALAVRRDRQHRGDDRRRRARRARWSRCPGILGHGVQKVRAFDYELPPGALLVMHSDGLRSGWDLIGLPGRGAARPAA